MRWVAIVAAGTGVHGGNEHERAGILYAVAGARDGYLAVFERLAQHLKRLLRELGQLVEEQYPVVSQRHFARHGLVGAPGHCHLRDRVVGTAEGSLRDERHIACELTSH